MVMFIFCVFEPARVRKMGERARVSNFKNFFGRCYFEKRIMAREWGQQIKRRGNCTKISTITLFRRNEVLKTFQIFEVPCWEGNL